MNTNKKTKGRLKLEMKKVEHKAKREVTFSKRKKGLFNKASELCELCGAEVAIILFSPHLKPFTFGYPDANEILQRLLTGKDDHLTGLASRNILHGINGVREQYNESLKRLEEEEKKSKGIKSGTSNGGFWWDNQEIENLTELDELEQYVESMEKLRKTVQAKVDEIDLSENLANEFINDQNLLDQNNFSLIPHGCDLYGV
ncbi:hypothetical protein Ddye_007495 [Dipteronia dyeriana]|uniref:MADS-box domain-containing protein n=1 Tax=Dipteronia dyeriana TaxID=168575 RepID=A0AAD9XKP5_9ROSI|nr:hypothetical protein Ddye_007495 [Dipteronia dyeriana]